ncbi:MULTISPECIES: tRNA guanosine(15) transglycosylase TgtA [Methanothrix]|jgi:7-cyano-7-deazaguanine tRNA-ribosyltransferase|uniref:tRNA guanosine(15) transglycosylase TgtA n=1 Tax=Methanothrix TaxID=2222 RepID=UPI000A906CEE|nr:MULTISPECIES: tRNA guanosine(15) transglycosylase TgtA [Methanothrix]MDD3552451.1 tRNA guanosine(15) transglycosylase TgtA [Methanothrix soehngenii]HNQ53168.1 tRNA guanosine(15) transglycosylase TgtA [Methanothrix soehngenii]HOI21459.1 tRNA guanosine(15) transglycosylase TgtA [Methanothrix soehngenii]HPY92829.1 tRNA guanosine(15) transglycosylase TgtA [Methanothrix soehngenii]HQN29965.1 tRNA guanosine(15) transglycosylase TgtA [Methanothrix soehngenii]
MPDRFEILHKDLAGRIGRLSTLHGTVETPLLMPVINPHLPLIPPDELASMGAEMVITNSYIINQDPDLREGAIEQGLHHLLGFPGPIMTDSGAFQLSVYGDIDVLPLEILDFQFAIKSDISVPLDIPTPPDVSRERAESELNITEERLREAAGLKRDALLAGPVQGSTYPDLRERAGRFARELGFDLYPIGGVVPLMEAYRFRDLVDVVVSAKKGLGSGVPVHLFGAGHPMIFALAAAMGCDLFDSAAYALYAREGRYLTVQGTRKLEEMKHLPCSCPVCLKYTQQELMDSPQRSRELARHNLYVSLQEIKLVRQSIRDGSLWDLLETRCRSHPRMLDGLKQLASYGDWLEGLDSASKSTFFYLSPESASRPEVIRHGRRIERISLKGEVLITDDPNANPSGYDNVLNFKPPFGPYPTQLSETYPFNAEVPAEADDAAIDRAVRITRRLIEANPDARFTFRLKINLEERLEQLPKVHMP